MSAKISGIAVYPLQKLTPRGDKIDTECDSTKVRCRKQIETPMEEKVDYNVVCAVNCDNDSESRNLAIEGSIEKTFGELIEDRDLERKDLNEGFRDLRGHYRQWWKWESQFPDWKKVGMYNVNLRLIDIKTKEENKKIVDKITVPVMFTKPNYEKGHYDIEKQWI